MKKGKVQHIAPTDKCLFYCPEYNQDQCLVHEKDARECQRLIPYSVACPACGTWIDGKRKYYDELYLKFTCESCGQWFSITWQDEDIAKGKQEKI